MAESDRAQRIAIVTGASSGIGLHTALGLARTGMRVVMTGRSRERTRRARDWVAERAPGAELDTALADFASLAAVRGLAGEILSRHQRIDVLINNAGLVSPHYRLSNDGYERTFAVNHLAPFLLTNLLLDRLRASGPARIITVASLAHRGRRIDLATITGSRDWSIRKAYGRSKLCNILFTRELARLLDGTGVVATCLHPGFVSTGLGHHGGIVEIYWRLMRPLMISVEKGADTSIFLATVPDPTPFNGGYVVGRRLEQPDPAARDNTMARRLWDESARLTGLD
jgi:NAD(P)-dependent dehydrogenase (short-subunit alcohol dehydrogenase family)